MPDQSKLLREGMRTNDLRDLVLPMLSVDEYESKISPDSVVLGFYVQDRQAAQDLNRFVQKAAADILDTEVSPAPDRHGYYLVFVEVPFDKRFDRTLRDVLKDVSPLTDINKWQISVRHHRGLVPLDGANVYRMVGEARSNLQEDEISDFLSESELPVVRVARMTLMLHGGPAYRIEGLRKKDHMRRLDEAPMDMGFSSVIAANRLQRSLGSGWGVDRFPDGQLILSRANDSRCLVLRTQ